MFSLILKVNHKKLDNFYILFVDVIIGQLVKCILIFKNDPITAILHFHNAISIFLLFFKIDKIVTLKITLC